MYVMVQMLLIIVMPAIPTHLMTVLQIVKVYGAGVLLRMNVIYAVVIIQHVPIVIIKQILVEILPYGLFANLQLI